MTEAELSGGLKVKVVKLDSGVKVADDSRSKWLGSVLTIGEIDMFGPERRAVLFENGKQVSGYVFYAHELEVAT